MTNSRCTIVRITGDNVIYNIAAAVRYDLQYLYGNLILTHEGERKI